MYYLLIPEMKNKIYWYYKICGENTPDINRAKHFNKDSLRNYKTEIQDWRWGVIRIESDGTKTIVRDYHGIEMLQDYELLS